MEKPSSTIAQEERRVSPILCVSAHHQQSLDGHNNDECQRRRLGSFAGTAHAREQSKGFIPVEIKCSSVRQTPLIIRSQKAICGAVLCPFHPWRGWIREEDWGGRSRGAKRVYLPKATERKTIEKGQTSRARDESTGDRPQQPAAGAVVGRRSFSSAPELYIIK